MWTRPLPILLLPVCATLAQETNVDLRTGLKISLPKDSPLMVGSVDLGPSKGIVRGGAVVLDLHASLRLKNAASKRVKGVTLLVLAQEVTPGGRGSVAVPALDVAPGEDFPVKIDLRMVRPISTGPEPLVQVLLDGVLFEDLSFFGANALNSKRQLTLWEMAARRDRKHFQQILQAEGARGLQREIIAAGQRQSERPRLDVQVVRSGAMPRASNAPATNYEMDREVQFSFLRMPGAPVELMAGAARIAGDQAKAPHLEIRNREPRSIRHLEIGLALRDSDGQEFLAATLPFDDSVGGKSSAELKDNATLRVSKSGSRVVLDGMSGFVNHVEFTDGEYWIPSRSDLADPRLLRLVAPSPEEQRLVQLYRRKGIDGLVEELRK
jgi:hypothetical protein